MRPADLSGGMRKRVALARAIAVQPEVVLYDEPTTGLDPINTARVNHLIMGLQQQLNITSVVVTHDMKSAFTVSDRIAMVHSGGVICQAPVDEFRASKDPRVSRFHRRSRAGEGVRRSPAQRRLMQGARPHGMPGLRAGLSRRGARY